MKSCAPGDNVSRRNAWWLLLLYLGVAAITIAGTVAFLRPMSNSTDSLSQAVHVSTVPVPAPAPIVHTPDWAQGGSSGQTGKSPDTEAVASAPRASNMSQGALCTSLAQHHLLADDGTLIHPPDGQKLPYGPQPCKYDPAVGISPF